jgi:chloramphenicol-sensitive protein RarD
MGRRTAVTEAARAARQGVLYGLAAYGLWGVVPVYFKAIATVPPAEVLAQRIVWSVAFLVLILTAFGRWAEVRDGLRSRPVLLRLLATTVLIALNWFAYIYGVSTGQIVQASLGYFVTPLVNVLFGLVFFRERLRPWQWAAVTLAAVGVVYLVARAGGVPWIALTLALSFGLYGLLRKQVPLDGLVCLAVETFLLLPAALGYLGWLWAEGRLALGSGERSRDWLLLASGVVTTVPLVCFGQAARRLRLTTLGFLQYLSPSLQLGLAVLVFGEGFGPTQAVSFGLIWAALALYSADALRAYRDREPAPASVPLPEEP